MKDSYVKFRGKIVTARWYEAWLYGYRNPYAAYPLHFIYKEEKEAFAEGQLDSRRDTLMEGTF